MQRKVVLTSQELKEIKKLKKKEQNAKIYKRLLAMELRGHGAKCKDVASVVGVCLDTIADWTNLFLKEGVQGLCQLSYEGRRVSKLELYQEAMKKQVKNKVVFTLSQMREWLEEQYGVVTEESWLYRFCKKNLIFPTKKPG